MTIKIFCVNPLRECCHVLSDETHECVIIDPGFESEDEFRRIKDYVRENGLNPVKIIQTHCHFDHVLGLQKACAYWGIKAYFHPDDRIQLERAPRYCCMIGLDMEEFTGESEEIADGDTITFGNTTLKVIATPGHTEGGVCFLNEAEKVMFTGDTLFAGSIGRTDHLGGNLDTLLESINTKLMPLDGDITIYPGHGPKSSIGYERVTNPFLVNG